MGIGLTEIERESYKDSPVHRLDGRIKIIALISIVFYVAALPRLDDSNFIKLLFLESYLVLLMIIGNLNLFYVMARILAVIPFGLGLAIFQPFIRQPFIETFTVYPMSFPFGLTMTYEGLDFGLTLMARFIVCVTSVIVLSSTMKMNDLVVSARRLGVPREFTLLLTMMVRYLFVFWSVLKRIRVAQKSRLFDVWNKDVPRKWILEQIGNTISSLFVQSYEQGERTYVGMLCRGYGNDHNNLYFHKSKLQVKDAIFGLFTVGLILAVHAFL
ncbi:cobalt transporter [Methanococcoides methylutens]|uniref:Cobalt transporter n=1 Tax=Methanococcoides methylutens TaxID=2226 RepID=A0A099T400_METMT|nr:cobalt ECF transporter T component CbiQ [Methanococcoides methylutens]KGK98951.1 cobalt transporter [Methanococcoides methylutens]